MTLKRLCCISISVFAFIQTTPQMNAQSKIRSTFSNEKGTSLNKRYESLVCAIALISTERGTGTGFFINDKGDLVTAAHVISEKTYMLNQEQLSFNVKVDQRMSITPHGKTAIAISVSQVDLTGEESGDDLAFVHTGVAPPCWIPLGLSDVVQTGDHLLSIGFPGIDNGNPILYEGFLSGRFKHPPTPIGQANNRPIYATYDVMKVQMPITPGASGSPVIDDAGRAVAVISESPMIWTSDLEQIAKVTDSGVRISGFDTNAILGQLATIVREFESPGSGYAVPLSYLSPKRGAPASTAKVVH